MKQVGVKKYILWYLFVRSRYPRKDCILPKVYHPILCLVATVLLCCTLLLGNACETETMRALLKFFSEKTARGNASLWLDLATAIKGDKISVPSLILYLLPGKKDHGCWSKMAMCYGGFLQLSSYWWDFVCMEPFFFRKCFWGRFLQAFSIFTLFSF